MFGCKGELWPQNADRLPYDWSYAGYKMGEQGIPDYPMGANVRDFKMAGDSDDADAIERAIDAAPDYTHVYFPAGTYTIRRRIIVKYRSISFRGDGESKTKISIPVSLTDVYGQDWSEGKCWIVTISP
jgi:activating signal cointegrator complex subunit 1